MDSQDSSVTRRRGVPRGLGNSGSGASVWGVGYGTDDVGSEVCDLLAGCRDGAGLCGEPVLQLADGAVFDGGSVSGVGGPANPGRWNRYAYVEGDPVNLHDPGGLVALKPSPSPTTQPNPSNPFPGAGPDVGDKDKAVPDTPSDEGSTWDPVGVSGKPPECDMKNDGNARVINFLRANRDAAATLFQETGLDANFILAWAGQESGWSTGSAATKNNNFFGLTTNDWPGSAACPAGSFAGFACFPVPEGGRSLLASGQSALSSAGGRYLTPALAAQRSGGSVADIARAIANAGFNTEVDDQGVTYGNRISDTFNSIARRLKCPD